MAGVILAAGLLAARPAAADLVDHSSGFANSSDMLFNQASAYAIVWSPVQKGALVLTDNQRGPNSASPFERSSAFTLKPVSVSQFTSAFAFQVLPAWGTTAADGFTFCIQNEGPTALGGPGGGLGYGPDPVMGVGPYISRSICIKYDIWQNWSKVSDTSSNMSGLFLNGAIPTGGVDLTPLGIDLHSSHVFKALITYDGAVLTAVLTDTVTGASATQSYKVDIPTVVGDTTAYVGFTGATGGITAFQSILAWRYDSALLKPAFAAVPIAALTGVSVTPNNTAGPLPVQGTVTIGSAVGQDTVVQLASQNPSAAVPASVTVPAGKVSATFPIATSAVTAVVSGSIIATLDATVLKTTLKVSPIGPDVATVALNYLPEGQATTGAVTLQAPAGPGPIVVTLSSANPQVAAVPPSLTFDLGVAAVAFPIQTSAVQVNTPVLITVTANGVKRTTTLTVRPLRVVSVTGVPASLKGGATVVGTVNLEGPAPAGGRTVLLSSDNAAVKVPASVTVPAGASSVAFPVSSAAVAANAAATITASAPANSVYAKVTATP